MTRRPAPHGAPMSEAAFQAQVLELCRWRKLLAYHTHDSRRSEAGFPDLVIVGTQRVIYRELKTDVGQPSAEQVEWLERLRAAGQDAAIWRPRHWLTITQQIKDLAR